MRRSLLLLGLLFFSLGLSTLSSNTNQPGVGLGFAESGECMSFALGDLGSGDGFSVFLDGEEGTLELGGSLDGSGLGNKI